MYTKPMTLIGYITSCFIYKEHPSCFKVLEPRVPMRVMSNYHMSFIFSLVDLCD